MPTCRSTGPRPRSTRSTIAILAIAALTFGCSSIPFLGGQPRFRPIVIEVAHADTNHRNVVDFQMVIPKYAENLEELRAMPVSTWFRKQADWEDRVITIADIAIDPSSLGESVVQQRYEAPLPDSATPVIELGLAAIKIDKIPPALLEIAGTHGAFLWIRYGYDAQGELLEAEQIDAYAASAPESRYIAPDRIQGSKPITVTLTRSGASIDQLAIGS